MNVAFPTPSQLERHKFTVDDVLEMTARGLIDKRAELLDGEIFDVPEDGYRHISVTMPLARYLMSVLDQDYFIGVQTTLRLSPHNGPSPDIYVLKGDLPKGDVSADRILLIIEVADTSLKDDLTDSASRYARHGVRDYWVVDANARVTHVHRDPKDGAYAAPHKLAADEAVIALLIPKLSITLANILGVDAAK
ncbi:MAG: Uma2 family endonuclease [Hyphomonadaceae bacterium]